MGWPDYYPRTCPPVDADEPSGRAFRLVRSNPPTEGDFLPLVKEMPGRQFRPSEMCKACGLSLNSDVTDSHKLRRRLPIFRNRLIAEAELTVPGGEMMETPNSQARSHLTLWVPVGVDVGPLFRVIAEDSMPPVEAA